MAIRDLRRKQIMFPHLLKLHRTEDVFAEASGITMGVLGFNAQLVCCLVQIRLVQEAARVSTLIFTYSLEVWQILPGTEGFPISLQEECRRSGGVAGGFPGWQLSSI